LEDLLTFGIENRKEHMLRMDQKTLEQILGFQMKKKKNFMPTKYNYSKQVEIIV
jgi:hypothetical protein